MDFCLLVFSGLLRYQCIFCGTFHKLGKSFQSEVKKIRAKVAATTQERILKDYQKDSMRDDDTLVQVSAKCNFLISCCSKCHYTL